MKRDPLRTVLAVSVIAACGTASEPTGSRHAVDNAVLSIQVEKSSYTWTEATTGGNGIRGTIRNTSDRDYYAKLGDAFNGSVDQEPLHIANFSDGTVERETAPGTWISVPGAHLIEGVSVVALRGGRTYDLIAHVSGEPRAGTHRIAVTYRTSLDDLAAPSFRSTSPSFQIR
jgi:hypothetical protein